MTAKIKSDSRRRAKRWLTLGIPALVLGIGYLPFLKYASQLPDPLASHFDASGQADAFMSIERFLLVTGALIFGGLAVCLWLGFRRQTLPEGTGAVAGFTGGLIAAMGSGILASTVLAQRNLEQWSDAPNAFWTVPFVLIAALVVGAIGAWSGARTPGSPKDKKHDEPIMTLQGDERAVWSATISNKPLHTLGVVSLVVALVALWLLPVFAGLLIGLSSLALVCLATVRVRIDRRGVVVHYGRLPWPKTDISLDRIASAAVIEVRPMEWGGWGYRGSLALANQAAIVVRAGPGLRIELSDGKVLVVTIDNPEQGAALLNALLRRHSIPE